MKIYRDPIKSILIDAHFRISFIVGMSTEFALFWKTTV